MRNELMMMSSGMPKVVNVDMNVSSTWGRADSCQQQRRHFIRQRRIVQGFPSNQCAVQLTQSGLLVQVTQCAPAEIDGVVREKGRLVIR
ncbi:hypothetical protein TK06_30035 [Pseudomonas fluorescens]|uniref:Uncharacterized protein n=1 Tax=Pseudomonas fluorescens TaxID=294 RepID=A0A165ZTM5_PSEFL|nr:hypothetical protein TK06_30035 [Pseudomonas fluorescens]